MNQRIRRLTVTMAAAVGLTAIATPALAAGTITGFVFNADQRTKVAAVAEDGTRHEAQVRRSGHFRIENVPAGTYVLEFTNGGTKWLSEEDAVVVDNKTAVVNTNNPKAQ